MPPIPKEQRAEACYLGPDVADRPSQKKQKPTPPTSTTPHQRQGDRGSDDDTAPRLSIKSAPELNFRDRLLTANDAANFLRLSHSWLAKARMRGDGPPFVKIGRSVRYPEGALLRWMKGHLHLSTSER